jgi:hypothetical protein
MVLSATRMWRSWTEICLKIAVGLLMALVALAPGAGPLYADGLGGPGCTASAAGHHEHVGRPTDRLAWRARVLSVSPVHEQPSARPERAYRQLRRLSARSSAAMRKRLPLLTSAAAPWVLVLGARRDTGGRCWLQVRLPWRPNDAAGWVDAEHVLVRPTRWRLLVSLAARTVTLYRAGVYVYRARVVIGARNTPTPRGLFAIASVWRSPAASFLGSYILPLTAHSNALSHFDGGDGLLAIHGRGGASLLDPLGSASSHGCVRLANAAIDEIVRLIGRAQLPGTPVRVE